jgi:uncharacterized protein YkwD
MTSPMKALLAFTLVFVGTVATVSHMAQRASTTARPALAVAPAGVPLLSGKPARMQPDQGCILLCEPPPDPVVDAPVADAPVADAPAPAPVVTTATPPRPVVTQPKPPPVSIGSAQQSLINRDRAAAGLPPLSWSGCLAGIAASWASYMARTGVFQHGPGVNQDFGCGLGSSQCGENIAWMTGGANDAQANSMFMASPEHRANILGPYRFVGTAWASGGGKWYIVEEFG